MPVVSLRQGIMASCGAHSKELPKSVSLEAASIVGAADMIV